MDHTNSLFSHLLSRVSHCHRVMDFSHGWFCSTDNKLCGVMPLSERERVQSLTPLFVSMAHQGAKRHLYAWTTPNTPSALILIRPDTRYITATNIPILNVSQHRETSSLCVLFDNDPSAGSPTETLLRLLLPLSAPVRTSFSHDTAFEGRLCQSKALTGTPNR